MSMLSKIIRMVGLGCFLAFSASCSAEAPLGDVSTEEFVEGKDYLEIIAPKIISDKSKIEVVEVFWYGCPHCYKFEPYISQWVKTKPDYVEFVKVPAVWNDRWAMHGRLFYVAEVLGVLDRIHPLVFNEMHALNASLDNAQEMRAFFARNGVSESEFDSAFGSFAVDAKMRRADSLVSSYGIQGVPAVVVNGRYTTNATMAGGHERVIDVINYLAEKERLESSLH